jgi:hypothetical protein
MTRRITETELLLPSLYLMSLNGGRITTSELIEKLRGNYTHLHAELNGLSQ